MKPIALVAWLLSYISIASLSAAIITPALPQIQAVFSLSLGAVFRDLHHRLDVFLRGA